MANDIISELLGGVTLFDLVKQLMDDIDRNLNKMIQNELFTVCGISYQVTYEMTKITTEYSYSTAVPPGTIQRLPDRHI